MTELYFLYMEKFLGNCFKLSTLMYKKMFWCPKYLWNIFPISDTLRRNVSFRQMINLCLIIKIHSVFNIRGRKFRALVIWHYSQLQLLIITCFRYIKSYFNFRHVERAGIIHMRLSAGSSGNILRYNGRYNYLFLCMENFLGNYFRLPELCIL